MIKINAKGSRLAKHKFELVCGICHISQAKADSFACSAIRASMTQPNCDARKYYSVVVEDLEGVL